MNNSRYLSAAAFVIGILIATMIGGLTYSSYYDDLRLLRTSNNMERGLAIIELELHMNELLGSISEYQKNPNPDIAKNLSTKLSEMRQYLSDRSSILFANDTTEDPQISALIAEWNAKTGNVIDLTASLKPLPTEAYQKLEEINQNLSVVLQNQVYNEMAQELARKDIMRKRTQNSMILSFLTLAISMLGLAYFITISARFQSLAEKNDGMLKRSRQAEQAKSRLLTMLSHEIRTPMNIVIGLATLLQEEEPDPEKQSMLANIKEAAQGLVDQIGGMLGYLDVSAHSSRKQRVLLLRAHLMNSLQNRLTVLQEHKSNQIQLKINETFPDLIKVDWQRYQEICYFLMQYLLEIQSEKPISFEMRVDGAQLVAKIDLFFADRPEFERDLELLTGTIEDARDYITSDRIETVLIQDLIEAMGGRITLLKSGSNITHHRVVVVSPLGIYNKSVIPVCGLGVDERLKIRIEENFEQSQIEWVDDSDIGRAELVFLRTTNRREVDLDQVLDEAERATIIEIGNEVDDSRIDYNLTEVELRKSNKIHTGIL